MIAATKAQKLKDDLHNMSEMIEDIEPKYWVSSDGDLPDRIFFGKVLAELLGGTYLDVFNAAGTHISSSKRAGNQWTQDF